MSKKTIAKKQHQACEQSRIDSDALLEKARKRIELLHPACPECRQIFAACGGRTIQEWEAKLAGKEPRDAFCVRLPFWPPVKER